CYEREQVPYKAFDGVVDALANQLSRMDQVEAAFLLPPETPTLARLFPVLRRVSALGKMPTPVRAVPDVQELRKRAFAALRELLARMARAQPVVLFIDDFQWADADSLALFGDLVHPPDAPPVLLLATLRPGADAVEAVAREAMGDVRHLHL